MVGIGNYTPWPFTSTFFVCILHPDIIFTYTLRRRMVENIQLTCSISSILWPKCRGCNFVIGLQIAVWTWQAIIGSLSRVRMPTVYRNWDIIIFLLRKWNHCWQKHSLAKSVGQPSMGLIVEEVFKKLTECFGTLTYVTFWKRMLLYTFLGHPHYLKTSFYVLFHITSTRTE